MLFKNTASQKIYVFAFDTTNNTAKTGDAANITAYIEKDDGGLNALTDTSAAEKDSTNAKGYYVFDISQTETNADKILITAKSSTANVAVVGAPAVIFTRPTTGWLAPTVAGRTLDVSAGGEAGVDWANIGSPTTTVNLSGTTVKTATDVETDTQDIQSRLPAALGANGNMKADIRDFNGTSGTFAAGRPEVNTTHFGGSALTQSGGRPEVNTTHAAGTAWGSGAITAASIASSALTAAKFAAGAFDAVWTVTTRTLTSAANITSTGDTITVSTGAVTVGTNNDKTGYSLSQSFPTNFADLAVTATTGRVTVGTNADKTGYSLSAAGIQAIWDALTSALTTVGSIGKLLVDNINATISSRATQTSVDTIDDFVDTEVAAIKAKTDQLTFTTANRVDCQVFGMQADTVTSSALASSAVTEIQSGLSTLDAASVRSAVGLASANLDTQLTAIDDYIDTEVAAIKAKTDNLPSDPADASDIAAAFGTVNSTLSTIASYIDTEVAAIKAKTDNLPAAPASVSDIPTANQNADALLDRTAGVETNRTLRQTLRLMAAVLLGKVSGGGTSTETFRDTNDTKDRVVAEVDDDGNRTSTSYDAS